jgi:predicted RNase H-like nuclease (RuvC/YqgF family)
MENTIHTVFSSDAQGTSTCASSDKLLLEKSRQIAELTLKLEQLSATLEDSQSNSNDVISSQCHSELTQAALSHVSASQYSWAVDHHGSCSQVKILSQDLNDFKQKCVSLERSMATLKRKNGEREIRSAQNLRMMRQQLDVVERQKARSLEKQRAMEQQILDLLKENKEKTERIALVEQSSEKCNKRDFFRHNGHGMYNDAKNHSKTDFWKDDEESYFPPILVASSLDDDTASETESQAGGLEK